MWFQANCPTGWDRLCLVMMMPLSCWWTGAVYVTRSVSWRVSCVFRDVFASSVMCLFHDVCVCFMMCMFHECVFHDVSFSGCLCFMMLMFCDVSVWWHVCVMFLSCPVQWTVKVYSPGCTGLFHIICIQASWLQWMAGEHHRELLSYVWCVFAMLVILDAGSVLSLVCFHCSCDPGCWFCLISGVFSLFLWSWMLVLSYLWCVFTVLVILDAGSVLSLVCFHCSCDPGCWFCLMQVDGYHKEEEKVKFERVKVDIEHLNLGKRLSGWLLSQGRGHYWTVLGTAFHVRWMLSPCPWCQWPWRSWRQMFSPCFFDGPQKSINVLYL